MTLCLEKLNVCMATDTIFILSHLNAEWESRDSTSSRCAAVKQACPRWQKPMGGTQLAQVQGLARASCATPLFHTAQAPLFSVSKLGSFPWFSAAISPTTWRPQWGRCFAKWLTCAWEAHPIVKCLQVSPSIALTSSLLLMGFLHSSRYWLYWLGSSHPRGLGSCFLGLAWPSSCYYGYLGISWWSGECSLSLLLLSNTIHTKISF